MLILIKKIIVIVIITSVIFAISVIGVNWYVSSNGERHIETMESIDRADCIIVLGAAVFGDSVSYTLAKRLDTAIEVYRAGKAPKIIVSGDHGRPEYNEVSVMREYLIQNGISKENIFMDHAGFNTYDTMYRAKDIFLAESAIIVTQREHLVRFLYIANKLGISSVGVESENYDEYEMKVQKTREFLARVKAFLQCEILHSKPKYLGETIPVWGSGLITED